MIWTLEELRSELPITHRNNKWVPARPENGKKKYASLKDRIKAAYLVFTCQAEAFKWPEGQ